MSVTAPKPLRPFLAESARCTTKAALGGVAISHMRRVFNIHVGGVFLLDEAFTPTDVMVEGTRQTYVEEYNEHWRGEDTVLAAVLERHVPVHNLQLHTAESWRRLRIIREYGRRTTIEPYMSAPLYGSGVLVGTLNFCRRPGDRAFGAEELELATVFSAYLSMSLAALPRDPKALPLPLTMRERQIARLVASGRNNLQIARDLGIARETVKQTLRRVYRKLGVSGRAEMAATLAERGWL
jgi:DNA-binding CsgD family transcriptional regulator